MNWEERIQILTWGFWRRQVIILTCCLVSLGNTLIKMCWRQIHLPRQEWAMAPASLCDAVLPTLRWRCSMFFGLGGLILIIPWRMPLSCPPHPQGGPFPPIPSHLCILPTVWLFSYALPDLQQVFYRFILSVSPYPNMSSERAVTCSAGFQAWGSGPFTSNRIQIELILFVFIVFIF